MRIGYFGEIPGLSGISSLSVEKAVDRCAATLVAVDELATQRVDTSEQIPAIGRLGGLEPRQCGLEGGQFTVVEIGKVGEVETITDLGQFDHSGVVGADVGVTWRSDRTRTLLLSEDRRECARFGGRVRAASTTDPLFTHDVEPALRDATNERHHVFLLLQTGAQRTELTERQRRRVDGCVRQGIFGWSDARTLEPTGNRWEDGHLIGCAQWRITMCFVAVAPHATGGEHRNETGTIPLARFVQQCTHGRCIDDVRAPTCGLAGGSK